VRIGSLVRTPQGWVPRCVVEFFFAECGMMDRFLAAEEKIVTPYKFGVYDLLVLPPAFPYGGMVGPRNLVSESR
jgi:hypothetical protein